MSKTTKQIRHMFNLGVAILFTGFVFAIGAVMGISFFLRVSSLLWGN